MTMLMAQMQTTAVPLTAPHSFTKEIEGPACDRAGNIYAVSFERKPTIGRVTPAGQGAVFVEMPTGSLGNGIRFDRRGVMFVGRTWRASSASAPSKRRAWAFVIRYCFSFLIIAP